MEELLKLIKNLDIDSMSDKNLEDFLPELGMNDEKLSEMPHHLSDYYGKGLKFWQYPNQFSKYLKHITNKEINSYLEIGCRWGGTFIITSEFLKLKTPNVDLFCCDLISQSDILNEYSNYQKFEYLKTSSFNLNKIILPQNVDLILIDGDHSYDGVKKDFEVSLQFNPKYVVFHDIFSCVCPGVVNFWNEIKTNYTHFEFTEQYDSVNGDFLGIGLIELKKNMGNIQNVPTLSKYVLEYVMVDLNLSEQTDNSLWLEFGVYEGNTINFISKYTDKIIFGFDCFDGLPEDWRTGFSKGAFNMDGRLPSVSNNVELIKGLFQDTLEPFLLSKNEMISFIHLDADLYSSTIYVLEKCVKKIKEGCIIVFDEIFNFPEYDGLNSELRALNEWVDKYDVDFDWVGICPSFRERAAIRINKIGKYDI